MPDWDANQKGNSDKFRIPLIHQSGGGDVVVKILFCGGEDLYY